MYVAFIGSETCENLFRSWTQNFWLQMLNNEIYAHAGQMHIITDTIVPFQWCCWNSIWTAM